MYSHDSQQTCVVEYMLSHSVVVDMSDLDRKYTLSGHAFEGVKGLVKMDKGYTGEREGCT